MKFREKSTNKFYAFALAAVFALVLAGCGGGGGTAQTPMTGPTDAERIAAAQTAAETAAGVAAAALAAVEANKSADLDSYIRASIANDNAQAALAAANDATTPAAAEAAQADAEAALADVQKYAGMVTTAHNAIEAARMELMALNDARAAAMKAYMDAKAALDAIAGQGDADSASYDMAVAALAAAMKANEAAKAAETSADAEAAQADAEAALADAMKYAGMVTAAHMEATALSDAQQAAMQAYMDAKAALMAAAADKDEDIASYTRAEDAVADAKAASDEAGAATTSEAAKAAQAKAEAAKMEAERFIGMIRMAKSDREEMERMAAVKKAANDLAKTKIKQINAEAGGGTDEATRPFDSNTDYDTSDDATGNDTANYRLQIKYDGGPKITITDGAYEAKNDPKFKQNGMENTRTMGDMMEVVVVHTDIDAPKPTPFKDAPGINVDTDTDTDYTGYESITIVSTDGAANHHDGMKSSRFMYSGDSASHTINFLAADDTATPAVKASEFGGTYDGAPGTYKCTGNTDCTVTVNKDNEVTAVAGTWVFTPNAGAMVAVPDSDYLHYGFWVKKKLKDGAVVEYQDVQTFAGSSLDVTTSAEMSAIDGPGDGTGLTATYEGNAAGVYGHKTLTAGGAEDVVSSGTFTADVSLTAYFGTLTSVASDKHNSIEGTVSDFVLSGGQANNWEVKLDTAAITNSDATFLGTGMAKGGGDAANWNGTFHGSPTGTGAPPVAVGEFNAHFMNGHVAGAFGTRLQKK